MSFLAASVCFLVAMSAMLPSLGLRNNCLAV